MSKTIVMKDDEQNLYTAEREHGSTVWLISYPEGDLRMSGSRAEIINEINLIMKSLGRKNEEEKTE